MITSRSVTRKVSRKTVLLREGERPGMLYIIQSGRVRASISNDEGAELVLKDLGPGEMLGELALIDGEPRMATVTVIEDATLILVSRDDFLSCLASHPEIAVKLLRNLVRLVRELADITKSAALYDVRGRVLRLLYRIATPGEAGLVVAPLTNQEIASMVSASREMVSRVMATLKNDGLIRVDGRSIILVGDANV